MTSSDLLPSALTDIDRDCDRPTRYTDETDNPAPGTAETADLLDAHDALDGVA